MPFLLTRRLFNPPPVIQSNTVDEMLIVQEVRKWEWSISTDYKFLNQLSDQYLWNALSVSVLFKSICIFVCLWMCPELIGKLKELESWHFVTAQTISFFEASIQHIKKRQHLSTTERL